MLLLDASIFVVLLLYLFAGVVQIDAIVEMKPSFPALSLIIKLISQLIGKV